MYVCSTCSYEKIERDELCFCLVVPFGCNSSEMNMCRLNASNMLEMLRGKRVAFVGDSLNRNMWESLVCILGNSVEDKSRMFEASGREEFRTEDSYSFIFKVCDMLRN